MTVTAVTALAQLCMTSQVFEKLCLVAVARVASASSRCLCEGGAVQFTLQRLLFAGAFAVATSATLDKATPIDSTLW